MNFQQKLCSVISDQKSHLCIGLDTDPARLPAFLKNEKDPVLAFNRLVIEATSDLVCAYKPNFAFYEALGSGGFDTLKSTLELVPEKIVTVADAKRGDIGNTARMYAKAIFDELNCDSVTVNGYMGFDAVSPFLEYGGRGIFVLALTSNPGARDFQFLEVDGKPIHELMLKKIVQWNESGDLGAVVGATHPEQFRVVRTLAPTLPLLIPGVGSQGGDLDLTLRYAVNKPEAAAMINVSRAVLYGDECDNPKALQDGVRARAMAFRDDIESIIKREHE